MVRFGTGGGSALLGVSATRPGRQAGTLEHLERKNSALKLSPPCCNRSPTITAAVQDTCGSQPLVTVFEGHSGRFGACIVDVHSATITYASWQVRNDPMGRLGSGVSIDKWDWLGSRVSFIRWETAA